MSDWRVWMNRGPSLTPRQLLLDPNHAQIKVERYMVSLGRVQQGEINPCLSIVPQVTFRPDRIVAHAHFPALVRRWWAWLFWWFAYPVLQKTYFAISTEDGDSFQVDKYEIDDYGEDERIVTRYSIHWRYPTRSHHARREYRAQGEALSHSPMVSLKIGGQEMLADYPISLHELTAPGGIGPLLSMPTVQPPQKIEVEFSGTAACTFTVSCMGFAALQENT